jgi:hypothetical protein
MPRPASADYREQIAFLKHGLELTLFERHRPPRSVILFVDFSREGGESALCWCKAGTKQRIRGQAIPLREITDLNLGKWTRILDSGDTEGLQEAQCFSIHAGDFELSFAAPLAEDVPLFASALNAALSHLGKEIDYQERVVEVGSPGKSAPRPVQQAPRRRQQYNSTPPPGYDGESVLRLGQTPKSTGACFTCPHCRKGRRSRSRHLPCGF